MVSQIKRKCLTGSQIDFRAKTCKMPKVLKNINDQGRIGYSFESDWLRPKCVFWGQFTAK